MEGNHERATNLTLGEPRVDPLQWPKVSTSGPLVKSQRPPSCHVTQYPKMKRCVAISVQYSSSFCQVTIRLLLLQASTPLLPLESTSASSFHSSLLSLWPKKNPCYRWILQKEINVDLGRITNKDEWPVSAGEPDSGGGRNRRRGGRFLAMEISHSVLTFPWPF